MKKLLIAILLCGNTFGVQAEGVDVDGNPITGTTLFGDIDGAKTTVSNLTESIATVGGFVTETITNGLASASNVYTKTETDDAIVALTAHYITADAQGNAFTNYVALTNAETYYSGGEPRTPTHRDYAIVLADETHDLNEWRYIYDVSVDGEVTNEQWKAQYPVGSNDYEALANRPAIDGTTLTESSTADGLGLLKTTAISADNPTFSNAVLSVGIGVDTNTVAAINALVESGDELPIGGVTTVGALLLAIAAAVAVLRRSKLSATSAAPAFSTETVYTKGDHVTHDGTLYECTSPVQSAGEWNASNWTLTDMTSPDATLDIMNSGRLRVVAADGGTLWTQGYDLASESATTLACDKVNLFAFPVTTAAEFSDATDYAIGDRVVYDGKVYKFTAAHAAGAWIGTDAEEDPDTQAFSLPTAPSGKVGDFILDIDNSANTVAVTASLTGLDMAFSVVVPSGQSLAQMLTFAAGEMAELYFTQTAFKVNNLPTWKIVKQVVENGGAA